MDEPLAKRKKLLGKTVRENQYLAASRFIEEKGSAFYRLAEQNNLEGIVAKRKNSKYLSLIHISCADWPVRSKWRLTSRDLPL